MFCQHETIKNAFLLSHNRKISGGVRCGQFEGYRKLAPLEVK
jgi:hypothetical protein